MVEAVERRWHEPDHGMWEARIAPRHHVYSKVMCWLTVDRALHVVRQHGRRGPAGVGRSCATGSPRTSWSTAGTRRPRRTRVAYGYDEMDASSLWIGLSGLLADDDPRFLATVLAIEAELRSGPAVYRYHWDDGLPGREGGFHICTAWLIEAYLRTGRRADAEELFEQMVDMRRADRAAARAVRPARRARAGQPPAGVQPPRPDPLRPAAGQHAQAVTERVRRGGGPRSAASSIYSRPGGPYGPSGPGATVGEVQGVDHVADHDDRPAGAGRPAPRRGDRAECRHAALRWPAVVPSWTTAAGVCGGRPCAMQRGAIAARFFSPIRSTRVPRSRASASQSTSDAGESGATCPETTVNSCATPRWVTGTPAAAGTATALVTPGTTVTGTPAAAQASTSSPPRPNTYGSPPLSRTTNVPARARSTRTG